MPPLPSVAIPVISEPEQSVHQYTGKGKQAIKPSRGGRTYEDGPLPVKSSELALRKAQIVERTDYDGVPLYQLRMGCMEVGDVTLNEILDYVSALDLEKFENKKFLEEREILRIVAVEEQREAEDERQREKQRRKWKAKTKGVVYYESLDEGESVSYPAESAPNATGRSGRPRPTYKHLYKLPKERRRRRRDPETGELMPLDDGDEKMEYSGDDLALVNPSNEHAELQGSLALPDKRPRRRRHPITKELMPLGWRYNPHEEEDSGTGQGLTTGDETNILKDLRISEEPSAKRPRLNADSTSRSVSHAPSRHSTQQALLAASPGASSLSHWQPRASVNTDAQGFHSNDEMDVDPSSEPVALNSITRLSAEPAKTSITNPSAGNGPVLMTTGNELIDANSEEDEYDIESILAHSMSNPKTHPPGLGNKPVMLYQVKWQGFDDPTWEPLQSFDDIGIVNEYHRRNGLKALPPDASGTDHRGDETTKASVTSALLSKAEDVDRTTGKQRQPRTSLTNPSAVPDEPAEEEEDDEEEELDEDEYEVERILSHRLSDPRSHPPELGRSPIMLYQVKWKSYHETTWEPADSFQGDQEIIGAYRRKAGLDR